MPKVSRQYSTWTAKASFNSHRSISAIVLPVRSRSLRTAKTGPMPISSGAHPATAKPRNTPSGRNPFAEAAASLITTHAAAPSENWLALPAATTPPGKAGLIFATPS